MLPTFEVFVTVRQTPWAKMPVDAIGNTHTVFACAIRTIVAHKMLSFKLFATPLTIRTSLHKNAVRPEKIADLRDDG